MNPQRLRRFWRDAASDCALIAKEAPTKAQQQRWEARGEAAAILAATLAEKPAGGDQS